MSGSMMRLVETLTFVNHILENCFARLFVYFEEDSEDRGRTEEGRMGSETKGQRGPADHTHGMTRRDQWDLN